VIQPRDVHISIDRLLARIDALGSLGAIDGGGSSRLAFTEIDGEGRDLVVTWMRDLDLDVSIDGIGNVVAVRPGRNDGPPVMMGSHIDTVRSGGRFDGNLGVLAGLEVIETLADEAITTDHPIGVGFFSNEEGARFAPDMMGSLVYVGGMALEVALDTVGIDGSRVRDDLEAIGYLGSSPVPGRPPKAFVELHIEQGPVLEEAGVTIGVVEGVQGISWTEVTFTGESNHAGTTPMRLRHDAGYAAAATAVFARDLAERMGENQVATCGAIDLHPNLVNVVAGGATITVDLRNTDEMLLREAEGELAQFLDEVAGSEGVTYTTRNLARFEPVVFDPDVVDLVESSAVGLDHSVLRLPSGAGHDAQMMARVCPTAMVFVPSINGISHNPAELTNPADLQAGADVLLQVILGLATDAKGSDPFLKGSDPLLP